MNISARDEPLVAAALGMMLRESDGWMRDEIVELLRRMRCNEMDDKWQEQP